MPSQVGTLQIHIVAMTQHVYCMIAIATLS